MPAHLHELSSRTVTDDSDYIHVSNNSTDYKQTKANFLSNTVTRNLEIDSASSMTSQIPTKWGPYAGYVDATTNAKRNATGMPVTGAYALHVYVYSTQQAVVHADLVNDNRSFTIRKNSNTWGDWEEDGMGLKTYDDTEARATITGTGNNYAQVTRPSAVQGKNVVAMTLLDWTSNTGPFTLVPYASNGTPGNYDYVLIASGQSVTGLKIRYWYI